MNKAERVRTGIKGVDAISNGGIIKGKVTLLAGTTGSGKTIFGTHFLMAGVEDSEGCVFVTFEEPADDLRTSAMAFGWDIAAAEEKKLWRFVDCSPREEALHSVYASDDFSFSALMARIEHAVKTVGAKRVVIDSLNALLLRYSEGKHARTDMLQLALLLRQMGVTALITTERSEEYGPVSDNKVIEFIVDCVLVLRNVLEHEKRRRTVEILKYRGGGHKTGEFPFGILSKQGIVAHPPGAIELAQKSSTARVSCGVVDLDKMCGGGFLQDSIVLVAGPTGTGKTLIGSQFIGATPESKERRLLIAFEESPEQLFRNAESWGIPLRQLESEGLLKVHCTYPEMQGIEEHLIDIHQMIEQFRPTRLVIDSLSAIERAGSTRGFQEFVINITALLKQHEICTVYTAATQNLIGATMIANGNISTIADSIILLRYVELFGKIRRGLAVLKMRGSAHEVDVREVLINNKGMQIGERFELVAGVLSGQPVYHGSVAGDGILD